MVRLWVFFVISITACISSAPRSNSSSENSSAPKQLASAPHGLVSAAHPLASEAGTRLLQDGGNVVDAVVAASFAISVLRPHSSGIGGGGFLLFYKKDQDKVSAYDFRERAPERATKSMFIGPKGTVKDFIYESKNVGPASTNGHLAVGVPGLVAGLLDLHKKYGMRPLAEVLAPAIKLADEGFKVYPSLAKALKDKQELLRSFPDSHKIFLPNDRVLEVGETLVQKDLANTLRLIAQGGKESFYNGPISKAIVTEMKKGGGLISQEDLSSYQMIERQPIEGNYRSYRVIGMPPPSSGGVHIIQILNMLSSDNVGELQHNSVKYLHLLAEVMRRAFADRARFLGDPKFFAVPTLGLLNKDYALKLRKTVDLDKATPSLNLAETKPTAYESPSTTHLSAIDRWGNAISTTQTINTTFGSGLTVAGIVLNNEMDDFSVNPGTPNAYGLVGAEANSISPRKTMLSSMSPTLVFDSKKELRWVLGSPGGPRIITATLQTIINLIDFHMPLWEAVQANRIHHQWLPDELVIEENSLSPELVQALERKGHHIRVSRESFGDVEAVERLEDGTLIGVADRRSEGQPVGY